MICSSAASFMHIICLRFAQHVRLVLLHVPLRIHGGVVCFWGFVILCVGFVSDVTCVKQGLSRSVYWWAVSFVLLF